MQWPSRVGTVPVFRHVNQKMRKQTFAVAATAVMHSRPVGMSPSLCFPTLNKDVNVRRYFPDVTFAVKTS